MHDSCPDCAGTQPKRTIIPVYPKLQSVIEWPGPVTCDASLTPGRPSGCAPGERGAGTRRCTGADGGAGCPDAAGWPGRTGERGPGRGGLAGADGGAGCPDAAGWPAKMHPYRLPGHGAIRLLELLSGVREDHPKVVLE